MIRYHGTPITPEAAAAEILTGRHGMVSFARPEQIGMVAEACQSFAIDNGAFSMWKRGGQLDISGYISFVEEWRWHPGFDWCLIPDVIDGTEADNRRMIEEWMAAVRGVASVPVWHLHESLEWLEELIERFPRIALGSSGEFAAPGKRRWRERMDDAFTVLCDEQGRPKVKDHGLRMMNPTIFSRYPFASVDSTNVARNVGICKKWERYGNTKAIRKSTRGVFMALRCEHHACASVFVRRARQQNFALVG